MIQLKQDPLFNEDAVAGRIQNLWMQYQAARTEEDLKPLWPYFTDELYAQEEAQIRDARLADRIRDAVRPAILNRSVSYEGVVQGREILTCHMLTRCRPRETDKKTGEAADGAETFYREDWTLSRPQGTLTPREGTAITVHCPGCGATMSMYKSAVCPFCKRMVRVPDFTWTVEKITRRIERNP